MKNRLSIKLYQKNLLTEKKNMSWKNIPASLTCERCWNATQDIIQFFQTK